MSLERHKGDTMKTKSVKKKSPKKRTKTTRKKASKARRKVAVTCRNIVVPVDFSEESMSAVEAALPFARKFKGKIHLVHIVEPVVYPPEAGLIPVDQTDLIKASKRQLERVGRKAVPDSLRGRMVVDLGHPPRKVTQVAKRLKGDLIVLSTHGYTGIQHVLMGSNAERIVRYASCPVLVVRQPD